METKSLFNKIRNLIGNGKIKEALDESLHNFNGNENYNNLLTLLSSRYSRILNHVKLGIISNTELQVEVSNISYRLLTILNEIEESDDVISGKVSTSSATETTRTLLKILKRQ